MGSLLELQRSALLYLDHRNIIKLIRQKCEFYQTVQVRIPFVINTT